jgi:hypothetical protein
MFIKTQASGTGLTLVSALAPTLGIELPYWARLGGAIVGMVMLIWPALNYIWNEFRAAPLGLKIFLVCCAIPVAVIWGAHWWITPTKIVIPAQTAPAPPPPKPTPTPAPSPSPKPKEPWASNEDIEKQRKLGRKLLI